jgi:hypothetical protein
VKAVSERLGHAHIAFTMDTYQQARPDMSSTPLAPPSYSAVLFPQPISIRGKPGGRPPDPRKDLKNVKGPGR